MFHRLSSLTIAYPNLGFNSSSLKYLVQMYVSSIPTSNYTVLRRLYYSPSTTKWILLEIFLVCLVFSSSLSEHTADFLSNITRGACYRTTYGSLFRNHYLESWSVIGNMCEMINWYTLIKNNIRNSTSISIWRFLPDGIIENHQLVISHSARLSQNIR